jgi:hypothetical protein
MIFALLICISTPDPKLAAMNGCRHPETGMVLFQSAAECQRIADQSNGPPDPFVAFQNHAEIFQKIRQCMGTDFVIFFHHFIMG